MTSYTSKILGRSDSTLVPIDLGRYRLPIGAVLVVNRGLYDHTVVFVGPDADGDHCVASVALGIGIEIQSMAEFARGNRIYWDISLVSNRSAEEIVRCVQSVRWTYDLASANCEQFVRYVLGLPQNSPQVARAVLLALSIGLVKWASEEGD